MYLILSTWFCDMHSSFMCRFCPGGSAHGARPTLLPFRRFGEVERSRYCVPWTLLGRDFPTVLKWGKCIWGQSFSHLEMLTTTYVLYTSIWFIHSDTGRCEIIWRQGSISMIEVETWNVGAQLLHTLAKGLPAFAASIFPSISRWRPAGESLWQVSCPGGNRILEAGSSTEVNTVLSK